MSRKSSSDPLDGDTGEGADIGASQMEVLLDDDTGDGPVGKFGAELDGDTGGDISSEGYPLP